MPARIRDRLKLRTNRLGEVLSENALLSGQANSQLIVWGADLAVGSPNTTFTCNTGEVVIHQNLTLLAALANQSLTAGAATAAGQFRKVLISRKADGTLVQTAGAAVVSAQVDAVVPKGSDVTAMDLAYIEIPPSFVVGTTVITSGMLFSIKSHQ